MLYSKADMQAFATASVLIEGTQWRSQELRMGDKMPKEGCG